MPVPDSILRPLAVQNGVQPVTEVTALSTRMWTSTSKIRFFNGRPQKIGGWSSFDFDSGNTISGTARSLYSARLGSSVQTTIGTEQKLYSVIGSVLTNITPLNTSTTTIANSIDTHYDTLGSDPVATTSGSADIVITDSEASNYAEGDTYTLSGATTTNGVPDTEINADHIVRNISGTSITLTVTTTATSTGSGGGASVVRTSGLITFAATGHAQADGDRVKITGAADTGGITAAQINLEFIIRNKATNSFDVMTAGTATSSVSSGGGASTAYQVEIADGAADEAFGQGYGAGKFGVGLYGTALQSSSGRILPRIWYFDRFGDNIIMTPGNQTGVYTWDGATTAAPTLISNAPTAVNYAFVSDSIIVTLGAGGVENRIFTSDQGASTTWTASSTNQVFDDTIEGAGRFISHTPVSGLNLLHSELQVYTFRKIPRDSGVWEVKLLDPEAGLIAPMARIQVNGVAYWMGLKGFHRWRSGRVEVIPCTITNYVFDDYNSGQKSKFFCWYNKKYNEIWWHYCSEESNDPDRVARLQLDGFIWSLDTFDRTAAEYPVVHLNNPRLMDGATLYRHEVGNNDDGSAMSWSLTGPLEQGGKDNSYLSAIIPDSVQTGSITHSVSTYEYPQSSSVVQTESNTVTATTERVPIKASGKFWQHTLSGSEVDQGWIMGKWHEEISGGSPQ